jgi:phytoene dehydrogenase-like protein
MSGLAAAIRLALFGKEVLLVEKHNAPGGLNSFYSIEGRKYDVGLHALTNFVPAGVKHTPLPKVFRQLRIKREDFDLNEQSHSSIYAAGVVLRFANDLGVLQGSIRLAYGPQAESDFERLVAYIRSIDDGDLQASWASAREAFAHYLHHPALEAALLLPLFYYGNAQEDDMDLIQAVTLFKAIYLEGFARPFEGVRQVIRVLLDKYRALGGKRKMKCGVRSIVVENGRACGVILDDGTHVQANHVLSSAGYLETLKLCQPPPAQALAAMPRGAISCTESISVMGAQPADHGWDSTIVFYNTQPELIYRRPQGLVDLNSGTLCLPNNYRYTGGRQLSEGMLRVTCLASYPAWMALDSADYALAKEHAYTQMTRQALSILAAVHGTESLGYEAFEQDVRARDVFTPKTIERFTSHCEGALYGIVNKSRDGRTPYENLYICGTDQGYLGVIGALISGISMANYHVLKSSLA